MEEEETLLTDRSMGSAGVEALCVDGPSDDDITRAVGRWGRWQTKIFVVIHIFGSIGWMQTMAVVFFIPEADHWCKPPSVYSNWTVEQWKNYSIPPSREDSSKHSQCLMYDRDYDSLPIDIDTNLTGGLQVTDCLYGWSYDTSQFSVSVENEWDLVCKKEFWAKTIQSTYIAGYLAGVLIFGQISDLYGRRKTVIGCAILAVVAAILTGLAPSYWFFNIARFFVAMGLISSGTASFVLLMEITHTSYRAIVGIMGGFFGPFSYMLLTGFAYALQNWRHLQYAITAPLLLSFPLLWLVPESVKWLISRGRHKEAYHVLLKAAKENKRDFPSYEELSFSDESQPVTKPKKTHTILDLFKTPSLRKRTLILYFVWFSTAFVYYGISFGINSIGRNIYFNSFLSAAVEIPSSLLCVFTAFKFGRKWNVFLSIFLCGLCCLATAFFDKGDYPLDWPIVTLALLGKFGVHATFTFIYIFSAELFPTVVRNVGVGSSSTCARIGSIMAPYIDLLRHVYPKLPLLLYGFIAAAAGLLSLLLPETKDKPIPETIEEAEKIGR